MADKQIIINGCDVSGCDFYDKNEKYCLTLKMDTTGFKNPSCFSGDFQECIQDSKVCSNTFCDNNHNCYYKQLQQLKAENEELNKLKDEILNKKPSEREYCKGCTLPAYSKVIDEIEEYIYTDCEYNDGCDRGFCIRCKHICIQYKIILQLIKQAKEN